MQAEKQARRAARIQFPGGNVDFTSRVVTLSGWEVAKLWERRATAWRVSAVAALVGLAVETAWMFLR